MIETLDNKQKTQIAKIAANAMGISENNLKNCINEYPDGYFIWEPKSKGKMMMLDKKGYFLVAKENNFKSLCH